MDGVGIPSTLHHCQHLGGSDPALAVEHHLFVAGQPLECLTCEEITLGYQDRARDPVDLVLARLADINQRKITVTAITFVYPCSQRADRNRRIDSSLSC